MLRNSAIYLFGSLVTKAIPFALLPILTRHLNPEEYGLIALFLVAVSLTNALIGMNIKTNIAREYFHVREDEFRMTMTAIFVVCTVSFIFVQTFFLFCIAVGFNPIGIPDRWIAAVPLVAFMNILMGINLALTRMRERAWHFCGIEISNSLLTGALTLYLVVVVGLGWQGQTLAVTACSIFYGLFSLHAVLRSTGFSRQISAKKIREVLALSIPLFPHAMAASVIVLSDRLFIDRMIGTDATGIYSVGYQFGAVTFLFSQAYMKAWSPWFYRTMKEPTDEIRSTIVRLTYLSLLGILVLAIFYSWAAVAIYPHLVGDQFAQGAEYITWVSLSCVAYAIYQWFFPYLVLARRTAYLAFSSTAAMSANLLLNYLLIAEYGAIGAAYATFWAYLVSAILVMIAASRLVSMPWLKWGNA